MPQPPLLYQEGNSQPDTHSHLHRPRLQQIHRYLDKLRFQGGNAVASTAVIDFEIACLRQSPEM